MSPIPLCALYILTQYITIMTARVDMLKYTNQFGRFLRVTKEEATKPDFMPDAILIILNKPISVAGPVTYKDFIVVQPYTESTIYTTVCHSFGAEFIVFAGRMITEKNIINIVEQELADAL